MTETATTEAFGTTAPAATAATATATAATATAATNGSTTSDTLDADGHTTSDTLDADGHRRLGVDLYNHTWSLLGLLAPTPEQVDGMLAATHASAWHWSKAGGTLANAARSQWHIARVYSTLGRGEPALWHAHRCVQLAEQAVAAGVAEDWDVPAALEGLARAHAVAGDRAAAEQTRAQARAALEAVADAEDREQIEQDLASLPL